MAIKSRSFWFCKDAVAYGYPRTIPAPKVLDVKGSVGVPTQSKPKPQHPKGSRLKQKTPIPTQHCQGKKQNKPNTTQAKPTLCIICKRWNIYNQLELFHSHSSPSISYFKSQHILPKQSQEAPTTEIWNFKSIQLHGHYRIRTPPKSLQNHLPTTKSQTRGFEHHKKWIPTELVTLPWTESVVAKKVPPTKS